MGGGSQPVKVANVFSINLRVDKSSLGRRWRFRGSAGNRLGKGLRRSAAQGKVDVGKMFSVQLIKLTIIGRVMLRTVPPVPVTALGDEQFFVGQFFLLRRGFLRILAEEIARRRQMVPGQVVLWSANPDVKVRVDP